VQREAKEAKKLKTFGGMVGGIRFATGKFT